MSVQGVRSGLPAEFGPKLHLHGLRFIRAGRTVISDIDAVVHPGTVTALIGPNGAGKTTLLHLIAGVLHPDAGGIRFGSDDLVQLPRRQRAIILALGEQDVSTDLSLTAFEAVMLGRTPHQGRFAGPSEADRAATLHALAQVDALQFAERSYGALSGGERQRVNLARALAQDPRLLLLDEPTNHLDIRAQLQALRLARALAGDGVSVIAALHDLNHAAAFADQILVLEGGALVAAGAPAEVLTPRLIETVYGVSADVIEHPRTGRPLVVFDTAPAVASRQLR